MAADEGYLGFYPVGAFIVRVAAEEAAPASSSARAGVCAPMSVAVLLAPFTAFLKAFPSSCAAGSGSSTVATSNRLKCSGTCGPLTAFDVRRVTSCERAKEEGGEIVIGIDEAAGNSGVENSGAASSMVAYHRVTLKKDGDEGSAACCFAAPASDDGFKYVAVHATGFWTAAELSAAFSSPAAVSDSSVAGPFSYEVVAYVHQLRCLSAACGWAVPSLPAAANSSTPLPTATSAPSADGGRKDMVALNAYASMQRTSTAQRLGGIDNDANANASAPFTFSELFGGIGMFRLGLERAGGKASFAVELSMPARVAHEHNFGGGAAAANANVVTTAAAPAMSNRQARKLARAQQKEREAGKKEGEGTSSATAEADVTKKEKEKEECPVAVKEEAAPLAFDLTELPTLCFPHHDLLTAGFPCQSFAKAGPQQGLHDRRGWLFYEVIRVLLGSRPKAFLLENVANLVAVEEGKQLEEIMKCLRDPSQTAVAAMERGVGASSSSSSSSSAAAAAAPLHYEVSYRVIDGCAVTPQTRRRVYFIGIRCDSSTPSPLPTDASIQSVFDVAESKLKALGAAQPFKCVKDLLEPTVDTISPASAAAASSAPPHPLALSATQWEAVQRSRTFRKDATRRICDVNGASRTVMGSYRTGYQLYSELVPFPDATMRAMGNVQQFVDEVVAKARTVVVRGGDEGEEAEGDAVAAASVPCDAQPPLRFLSVREAARLQGIPDTFQFPQMAAAEAKRAAANAKGAAVAHEGDSFPAVYKLIGNAVNPLVIQCLGEAIKEGVLHK